LRTQIRIC